MKPNNAFELEAENSRLIAERAALQVENARLKAENEMLVNSCSASIGNTNEAMGQWDKARAENAELKKERDDWRTDARDRSLRISEMEPELEAAKDDSQWDATDAAHPAWWRGHDHTANVFKGKVARLEAELEVEAEKARIWGQSVDHLSEVAERRRRLLEMSDERVNRLSDRTAKLEAARRVADAAVAALIVGKAYQQEFSRDNADVGVLVELNSRWDEKLDERDKAVREYRAVTEREVEE